MLSYYEGEVVLDEANKNYQKNNSEICAENVVVGERDAIISEGCNGDKTNSGSGREEKDEKENIQLSPGQIAKVEVMETWTMYLPNV